MKTTKTKLLIGAAAIAITVVGIAFATPIVNLASPLLSVGHHSADIFEGGTAVGKNGQPLPQARSHGTTRIVTRQSTRLVTAGWRVVKYMPSATQEPITCSLSHGSSLQRVSR
jgi:hypothetical protein